MTQERILLIRTGGTIDSQPYEDPRNAPKNVETIKGAESPTLKTIGTLPNHDLVDHYQWGAWQEDQLNKDSKKFTEKDLDDLARIIYQDDHKFFMLTHGTDHIKENAAALQERLKGSGKTVVFVGAMVPLSMHNNSFQGELIQSDALENLHFALQHIHSLQGSGVRVVGLSKEKMRRDFYDPKDIEKDCVASKKDLKLIFTSPQR